MRPWKIALSVFFILLISFFVVRFFVHPKRVLHGEETPSGIPFFSQVVRHHPVVIALPAGRQASLSAPGQLPGIPVAVPRMAIVLDDWGKNYSLLKTAIEIHRPLTLSVIPNLSHSRQIAEEAHQNGLGVMLHMPMEPFGKGEPLEPHTIMTTMPDKMILQYLDEAISGVPYLEGVNNHMGSAATSDARVMRVVLSRLKEKNLFFIDSAVARTTQGPVVAKETGVLFSKRDVFIDNVNKLDAIKKQLEKAKRIALSHGEVIVIGHDRKLTLQAILEMLPAFDQAGVRLVFARDVVKASK